jgi:cytochrome c oxidase subunit 2
VGKGWSIFFGAVLFGTFIIWFIAPFYNWWLPENIAKGGSFPATGVDNLFYLIFVFVGFFFVLTEMILVYAMWKFAFRPGEKSVYTHGNHRLEMLWTAIPAAILLFIAVAQISVWAEIKYQKQMPQPDLVVSVMARQWEWRMRYPADPDRYNLGLRQDAWATEAALNEKKGEEPPAKPTDGLVQRDARGWAENPQFDDLHTTNELHCWAGAKVKVYLQTRDVIHSFTLPNLRLKQDTLPGKTIPMWFEATRHNTEFDPKTGKCTEPDDKRDAWEIACQELCGGRHFAMRGRLYVHKDRQDYEAWWKHAHKQQESRTDAPAVALNP